MMSRLDLDIVIVLCALAIVAVGFLLTDRDLGTSSLKWRRLIKTGVLGILSLSLVNLIYDASRLVEL